MLLTSLVSRVQLLAHSIPTNAAIIHLQETARRFFRRTQVWVAELTFDSVADQSAYALDLSGEVDAGTTPKVSRIQYVTYNGAPIHPQAYYLRDSDGYLVFNMGAIPGEAITDGIVVKLSIVPATDGTDFPSEYVERYTDGLVGGALHRLLKTPGRPYSNPSAAKDFDIDYKRDIVQACMDVDSEGTDRADSHRTSTANTGNLFG